MLNIILDLDTGLAKLALATTIKAGTSVPVKIITMRGATPTSPGASPAFELGLGTDAAPPVLKAYLDTFTAENSHTFTGSLDANDERLVDFMAGKGTVNMNCEVAWTVAGVERAALSFLVPVQPRVISGPASSESGPTYYTSEEVDDLLDGIGGGMQVALVAGTGNLTLSGTQTIDGEAVIAGDVVFAKSQTIAADRKRYTVAAGAWAALDQPSAVVVRKGAVNSGRVFVLSGANTYTERLSAVNNTSDADKPVSTAQAAADAAVLEAAVQRANHTGTQPFATISDRKADVLEAPFFAADAGSTDAYVVTLAPAITGYVTGCRYRFKANTANAGACTINFNSLGAKAIKKAAGGITTDLADNDIRAGQWVDLVFDGTNMQMQSTLGNAPAGGGGGVTDAGVAFVRTGGNNATAAIGDRSKPYSTIQAADAAGADVIDLGEGSFGDWTPVRGLYYLRGTGQTKSGIGVVTAASNVTIWDLGHRTWAMNGMTIAAGSTVAMEGGVNLGTTTGNVTNATAGTLVLNGPAVFVGAISLADTDAGTGGNVTVNGPALVMASVDVSSAMGTPGTVRVARGGCIDGTLTPDAANASGGIITGVFYANSYP